MKLARCAGVDEAGCGSLIGDLVACAVVVPNDANIEGVADSKALTAKKRQRLAETIRESCAWAVGVVTREEIDEHGLGWARRAVFTRALDALDADFSSIIVDGSGFFSGHSGKPYQLEPKADQKYECVAAASILAKVHRDAEVSRVCDANPEVAERYGWRSNMGYPTAAHRKALGEHGATWYHRASFSPCRGAAA